MVVEKYAKIGDKYTRLIEECSEVIKMCCKIQRFGEDSCNPLDSVPVANKIRLKEELGDVLRIIENEFSDIEPKYGIPNPFLSKEDGKWYWFDETELLSEPYDTKEEAEKELEKYVEWLEKQNYQTFTGNNPYEK